MIKQILLFFIFFLCSVSALKCYQCQSRDEGCLSTPPPQSYLVYCDSYSVCAKLYSRENEMDYIDRYCARKDVGSIRIGQCEEMEYATSYGIMGGKMQRKKLCTCNDRDGCNGIGVLKGHPVLFYFIPVLIISFFEYF